MACWLLSYSILKDFVDLQVRFIDLSYGFYLDITACRGVRDLEVGRALRRLGDLLVLGRGHVSSQLYEHSLHSVLTLPLGETGQLVGVDDAVVGVDTGQVDLADELDRRRLVRVLGTAVHLDTVDTVLVDGMRRSKNCAVPFAHEKILRILQTVTACLSAETLFSLLELLQ